MKRTQFVSLLLVLVALLAACTPAAPAASEGPVLKVTDGTVAKTYTVAQLQALGAAQATDKGVTYVGVPLSTLLRDAGIDPAAIRAVKAVASDGFTANYTADIFLAETTLVAYARADGPLAEEEGTFRMVVPDAGGKLNPRMLVEIQVVR